MKRITRFKKKPSVKLNKPQREIGNESERLKKTPRKSYILSRWVNILPYDICIFLKFKLIVQTLTLRSSSCEMELLH